MSTRKLFALLSIAALLFAAPIAEAAIIGDIFTIEAVTPTGQHGSWSLAFNSDWYDDETETLTWSLQDPIDIMDESNNVLATLDSAAVTIIQDPVVSLNFLVSTGGAATNFTVTSANLSFASIPNATARASGAVTITDNVGDGGLIGGSFPNNETYRAYYNDIGNAPATGTTFATLVPGVASGAFDSATSNDAFPAAGFSAVDENAGILGAVSSMSSQWKFSVDAGSSASGTSTYVVIPEPTTGLLMLGGFAVLLRRRG